MLSVILSTHSVTLPAIKPCNDTSVGPHTEPRLVAHRVVAGPGHSENKAVRLKLA